MCALSYMKRSISADDLSKPMRKCCQATAGSVMSIFHASNSYKVDVYLTVQFEKKKRKEKGTEKALRKLDLRSLHLSSLRSLLANFIRDT